MSDILHHRLRATVHCKCGTKTPIIGANGMRTIMCQCGKMYAVLVMDEVAKGEEPASQYFAELTFKVLDVVGSRMSSHERAGWRGYISSAPSLDQQRAVANELRRRLLDPMFEDSILLDANNPVGTRIKDFFRRDFTVKGD